MHEYEQKWTLEPLRLYTIIAKSMDFKKIADFPRS